MPKRDKLDRRTFIQAAGVLALGAGCGGSSDDAEPQFGPAYPPVPLTDGKSAVAIVQRQDADDAVAFAIALAGGIEAIGAGHLVFIKINAVHGATLNKPAIVSEHDMIAAVIAAAKRQAPVHVTVGDRSFYQGATQSVFQTTGIGEAALEAGADEAYAALAPAKAPAEWLLEQPAGYEPTWKDGGGIQVMRKIAEADHLIDLAVCKNHDLCGFSLSMKNFVGAIGDDSRQLMHASGKTPETLSANIAVLNGAFSPMMAIIDARTALINGGPDGVTAQRVQTSPGLVLASRDRVALDAAAAAVLQLELSRTEVDEPDAAYELLTTTAAWSLPQIVSAVERGLGASSADEVELRFDDVADETAIEAFFRP